MLRNFIAILPFKHFMASAPIQKVLSCLRCTCTSLSTTPSRRYRGMAVYLHSWPWLPMEVSDQLYAQAALSSGGKDDSTLWIGDWIGPRTGLDNEEKNCPCWESNPGRPARNPSPCQLNCLSCLRPVKLRSTCVISSNTINAVVMETTLDVALKLLVPCTTFIKTRFYPPESMVGPQAYVWPI